MHVVATAGHVDHGKSTLVRALTGMEPDRWAEERRRGMTIDLGYAWMTLQGRASASEARGPGGEQLAFVDVPGHERFVPNMLAGLGPVPAVMFVVAADGGWMPQSAEHLAAVNALGVRHGLLVITRSDLADPEPATRQARAEIARTSLGAVEAIQVSAVTGQGMDALRAALARLVGSLSGRPEPSGRSAPVRLWIDRSFTIRGAGTVVTGTLPAGTVRNDQELVLTPSGRTVRVRGLEALGEPADEVSGVARVALNLRGVPADLTARGMALIQPGRWTLTSELDVRVTPSAADPHPKFPPDLLMHVGSARTQARVRVLGADSVYARLRLKEPLPLHVGDRVILRDPGAAGLAVYGATVLDPFPPPLARRGAGAAAARELAAWPDVPAAADLLRRHKLLRIPQLTAAGVTGRAGTGRGGLARGPGALGLAARRAAEGRRRLLREGPARTRHARRGRPLRACPAEPRPGGRPGRGRGRARRRVPADLHQAGRGRSGRGCRARPREARGTASAEDRRRRPCRPRRPGGRALRGPGHRAAPRSRPGRPRARRRGPRRPAAARRRPGGARAGGGQGGGRRPGRARAALHDLTGPAGAAHLQAGRHPAARVPRPRPRDRTPSRRPAPHPRVTGGAVSRRSRTSGGPAEGRPGR